MKKIVSIFLLLSLLFSLCACSGTPDLKSASQMGTATGQNTEKRKEKGSRSNPYSKNETIKITSYEVESTNMFTRERTVINPAVWEITVGDLFEVTDRVFTFTNEDHEKEKYYLAILVPVTVKILSTTGDMINWRWRGLASCDICLVTKDGREVARGGVTNVEYYFGEHSEYESADVGNSYEGREYTFVVGGISKNLEVSSADEIEFLRFAYFDETGEDVNVFISLH